MDDEVGKSIPPARSSKIRPENCALADTGGRETFFETFRHIPRVHPELGIPGSCSSQENDGWIESAATVKHGCLRSRRTGAGRESNRNAPSQADPIRLRVVVRGFLAGGGLRYHASQCAQPGFAAVYRRIRLYRRRLATWCPPLSARTPRTRQTPGDPLSRPWAQCHVLDDHRQPSTCAVGRPWL